MKRNFRTATLGVLALTVLLGTDVTPAQAQKKITFLANFSFHGRHSPFFVGLEKGFYKQAGFDINILPATGSGFVISALEGGKADYGMSESTPVVQAVAKGGKAKGFGVFMDITTTGLASLTPYPSPDSVAGKTIAASLTNSVRAILPIVFKMKGLDPSSVKWEAADPNVAYPLLLERRVDLIVASIDGDMPALVRIATPQGKTIHFTSFADWGYDVFGYFLVTQSERIAKNPDEVRAFAAATVKSVKYALDNPEETARIMVKHNPTLDYNTTLQQWQQSIKAIKTSYVQQHGYGIATTDRLQRTIDLTKQAFNLELPVTPNDIYAPGFITP